MIPVTVLTGFLGAGKTTLLSGALRDPAFARTAVVVNEFGEIGLDHELIETSDEAIVQLTTGCLCCAVQGDLTRTLVQLLDRRSAGEIAFDRLVIETSGLADPAPALHAFMTDRALAKAYARPAIVTTVDATLGEHTLAQYSEARKQVALADRLLLTKMDLVDQPETPILTLLSCLNRSAPIVPTAAGRVTPDMLFGPPAKESVARSGEPASDEPHTFGISTVSLTRDRPVSAAGLLLYLEGLAAHAGDRLLRVKGIINIAENPDRPMVIHGVQHVFYEPAWLDAWPSKDRRTRIVFIARSLPQRWPGLLLEAVEDEVEAKMVGAAAPFQ